MIKMLRWFLSILWNRFESCLQHLDVMNSLQYDLQLRQFARLQVSRQQRLQFLHVSSTDIACVKLQSVQPETHDYCWWLTIVEMLILILLLRCWWWGVWVGTDNWYLMSKCLYGQHDLWPDTPRLVPLWYVSWSLLLTTQVHHQTHGASVPSLAAVLQSPRLVLILYHHLMSSSCSNLTIGEMFKSLKLD